MSRTNDRTVFDIFLETATFRDLWNPADRLLVGISGGPDSTALASLARQTGQLSGLTHVHYGLRAEDADGDEAFVRALGESWEVPVHVLRVQPEDWEAFPGDSVQMAARQIRYSWWQELLTGGHGTRLLTGHQADDVVETILLQWLRGQGPGAWTGIPFRRGAFVRPLLNLRREHLLRYLHDQGLSYRTDSSNHKEDYLRNRIRHQLIPRMTDIQPRLTELARRQADQAQALQHAAEATLARERDALVQERGEGLIIGMDALRLRPWAAYALHQWLGPLGFTPAQQADMLDPDPNRNGQLFHSTGWQALHDRGRLLVEPRPEEGPCWSWVLRSEDKEIQTPVGRLHLDERLADDKTTEETFYLDIPETLLRESLVLRPWAPGDRIRPVDRLRSVKVKRILTDHKVHRFDKARTLVLTRQEEAEVFWLLGMAKSKLPISEQGGRIIRCRWYPSEPKSGISPP